ncbi:MAG: hypothetical protein DWQ36_05770 [Acidobacteria bacterium]|nr:MAG: hypothetical protein DWQ30_08750 [Acidobacteriota bacterium]REK09770.1 MAG: hypothetical protein DWQ36_05770 [Acidobacteriota bacterium]
MSDEGSEAELLELAGRLADGRPVDWKSLGERDRGKGDSPVHRGLRGLARLAHLLGHFDPPGADDAASARGVARSGSWCHLELREPLGSGSFGEVWRAWDPVLQRDVALKLLRRRGEGTASFLAEARRLARVRHPNVLAIYGADVDNRQPGLWSDLIEGETLEQRLTEGGRLPVVEILAFGRQVADALAAVHDAEIVHGDVKASNVMLQCDGRAVLMDFGAGSDGARREGPAFGSPLSMAPELFAGGHASKPGDVYAFGVLLFRALIGRYPVQAETLEQLEALHANEGPGPWTDDLPALRTPQERALRELVQRMLERRADRRPAAVEIADDLRRIVELPARRRRRRALGAVLASLSLALVSSLVGWSVSQRARTSAEQAREEAEATTELLRDVLLAPGTRSLGPDARVIEVMDRARERAHLTLERQPTVQGRVLGLVGQVEASLGRLDEGLQILKEGENALARSDAPDANRERAFLMIERGRLLAELGRHEEARAELDRVAEEHAEEINGLDLWVAWTRTLAIAAIRRGDQAVAERSLRAVVERLDRRSDDPRLFQARSELASLLERQGRLAEAERLHRSYLTWCEEHYGDRHESTIAARHRLSTVLAYLGRWAEAERLLRRNVDVTSEWLGRNHELYAWNFRNLVNVLGDGGEVEQAAQLDPEALRLTIETWGEDHFETQVQRMNAANRQLLLGRHETARPMLEQTVEKLAATQHEAAPALLHARMLLAQALLDAREFAAAEKIAAESVRRARESLGADSPLTITNEIRLARARLASRDATHQDFDDAMALARSTVERAARSLGELAPDTIEAELMLGEAQLATGDLAAARASLCAAHAKYVQIQGPEGMMSRTSAARLEEAGGCPD